MLARHAVAAVAQVESGNKPTLWLPSYFCPEVADCCRHYCEIREYRDMPFWAEADWKSLEPKSQDIVLAVNYFGVRDGTPWKNWRERVRCILLAWIIHEVSSQKSKDALKGMMNTGFARPAFPFGASIA